MNEIIIHPLPVTFEDLLKLESEDLSFRATWKDYLYLLDSSKFRMEFDNNTIYPKCFESDNHAAISVSIIVDFIHKFTGNSNFKAITSNHRIYINNHQKVYLPDAYIILGESNTHTFKKGFDAHTNPWLIAEILSPSTSNKDWSKKLPFYKKIPSLKYILYIEQDRPLVSVFTRKGKSSKWENIDYDNLKDTIKIEEVSISLTKIYNKINFIEKETH